VSKKIIYEGLYEDVNKSCQHWNKRDEPFNYEIDGESIITILNQFEGKKMRITLETIDNNVEET
jgi:hypothetical protein